MDNSLNLFKIVSEEYGVPKMENNSVEKPTIEQYTLENLLTYPSTILTLPEMTPVLPLLMPPENEKVSFLSLPSLLLSSPSSSLFPSLLSILKNIICKKILIYLYMYYVEEEEEKRRR